MSNTIKVMNNLIRATISAAQAEGEMNTQHITEALRRMVIANFERVYNGNIETELDQRIAAIRKGENKAPLTAKLGTQTKPTSKQLVLKASDFQKKMQIATPMDVKPASQPNLDKFKGKLESQVINEILAENERLTDGQLLEKYAGIDGLRKFIKTVYDVILEGSEEEQIAKARELLTETQIDDKS